MIVIPDSKPEDHRRSHPWGETEYQDDRAGRYVDFKSQPELVRTELEDFAEFEREPAVQTFYEMLEWLNRPMGLLETNDCAFRGPEGHQDALFGKTFRASGRVQFFLRSLEQNAHSDTVKWLWRMLHIYLALQDRDEEWVIFETSIQPTDFLEIHKLGSRISVTFSAYGETPEDCFGSLTKCFSALFTTFRRLESAMRVPIPAYP